MINIEENFDNFLSDIKTNKYIINDIFNGVEFEKILDKYTDNNQVDSNYTSEIIPHDDGILMNQKVFRSICDGVWISYVALDKESENFICNDIQLYYTSVKSEIANEIKNSILQHLLPLEENGIDSKLFTVCLTTEGLSIEPIPFTPEEDISKYYHPETFKRVNTWIKKSKKENKGLSFFYGEKGRGKTSILKYISDKLDRIVLFIPTNYLDITINSPEFMKILKNSKYLIVIDDAEVTCTSSIIINNIHQLVDGILSDSLGVHILLIFNSELSTISSTILNANNIIDKVEFKKLKADYASEFLGKKISNDINLIDLFKPKEKEKGRISL